MVSAFTFGALEQASPARQAIADPLIRRCLIGLAMGGTAMALIYSPWGKQSGAHINPSTGVPPCRQLRGHISGKRGSLIAFGAELADCIFPDDGDPACLEQPAGAQVYRGWAGVLVAVYIALEAPLSGMSMNPALFRLCVRGSKLDGALGLLQCAAPRHARCGGGLRAGEGCSRYRLPSCTIKTRSAASSAVNRLSNAPRLLYFW